MYKRQDSATHPGAGAGRTIGVSKVTFLLPFATEVAGCRDSFAARGTGGVYGLGVGWRPGRGGGITVDGIQAKLAQLVAEVLITGHGDPSQRLTEEVEKTASC